MFMAKQFMLIAVLALGGGSLPCLAQAWDVGGRLGEYVSTESDGKLKLGFEQKERYESRTATAFGRDPDLYTGLVRNRLSLTYTPEKWLKFSAMMQDSRSPWYGAGAPNSVRDETDLQEGYVSLFEGRKTGLGMSAGRLMLSYGESRLIGSPQWGNVARTWDHARVWYGTSRALFEASRWTAISMGTPPPATYVERTVWPGALGAIITTSRSSRGTT